MSVIKVDINNFASEVLKSDKPVLVDFYADWCGPCQMMAGEMEAFAAETEDVKVCKINVDETTDLALTYGIMSIPAVLLIDKGEEINRFVGAREKAEIAQFVSENK